VSGAAAPHRALAWPFASSFASWWASSVALRALVRRDLTGTRRGPAVTWSRTLAILASGGIALMGLTSVRFGPGASEAASVAGVGIGFSLLAIAALLAPSLAVTALRREREAGMLDLLLLAGVTPRTLVLGRILSAWLFLESLLLASMPALALFWFFRRPSLRELLDAGLVLSLAFLAVAALGVAVSAWCRNAGLAVAATLIALAVWLFGSITLVTTATELSVIALLLAALHVPGAMPTDVTSGLAVQAGVALVLTLVAIAGVRRRPPKVQRDVLLETIEKRRPPVRGTWPLTWLVQRTSAPARPGVLAIVVGVPSAAFLFTPPEAQLVAGCMLVQISWLVAAVVGATLVAPAREKRTWDSLLTTSLPGARIAADLLRATLIAASIPLACGLVLALPATLALGNRFAGWAGLAAAAIATLLLSATAGVAASVATRSAGGALAMTGALVLVPPVLAMIGAGLGTTLLRDAGDLGWIARTLLLLLVTGLAGSVLGARTGHAGVGRVVALSTAALAALFTAFVVASGAVETGAAWHGAKAWIVVCLACYLLLGASGVLRFSQGHRRGALGRRLAGVMLIAGTLVMPLAMCALGTDDEDALLRFACGGAATVSDAMSFALEGTDGMGRSALLDASTHVAYALALALSFWGRRDAYLGRADGRPQR
jgi:hypothetical protein